MITDLHTTYLLVSVHSISDPTEWLLACEEHEFDIREHVVDLIEVKISRAKE